MIELSMQIGDFYVYFADKYEVRVAIYDYNCQQTGFKVIKSFKTKNAALKYMHGYHKMLELKREAERDEYSMPPAAREYYLSKERGDNI